METKLTIEQQQDLNELYQLVDTFEKEFNLTLFQIAFLKDVYFYTQIKGEFRYYKKFFEEKYKEVITPKQMEKEINQLVGSFINKEIKKTIVNGKYSTIVKFEIAIYYKTKKDVLEEVKSLNKFKEQLLLEENYERIIFIKTTWLDHMECFIKKFNLA